MISDQDYDIGGLPIPVLNNEKPIEEFLTLKERMEVALLVSDDAGSRCAGLRIIDERSPQGVWCGFSVPHNFFVMVNISKVNSEGNHHTAYCEEESITTLGAVINRRVLWSGYKVRPTEPLGPFLGSDVKDKAIGGPPIPFQPGKVKNKSSGSGMKANDGKESEINSHTVGSEDKVDNGDTNSPSANLDRPLWRSRICYLLKDDLSILGKAKIVVCLPNEPFDEENLRDTDAGVLFLFDGDLQMTSFCWPLAQVRLEGRRLLSEIVTWCSDHGKSLGDDSGLEGAQKNPYRDMKKQKLSPLVETKFKWKLSDSDVQRVSSLRCCKFRCCQSFSWDDTLALRSKFYGSTFEVRKEIAYVVQGQLHSLPERRKKFLTLSGCEVCEKAWYSIHGVSRAAYHKYKAGVLAGRVNGTHGNSGLTRLRPHTIQAEANFATIIQEKVDRMPNEFRNIGRKRVNNLLVVPSALNWEHMRDISNSVLPSLCFTFHFC